MSNETTQADRAAKIKKNLLLMKEMRDQEGPSEEFFKLNGGERTVLEFTGDFEPVLRQFPKKDDKGNVIKNDDDTTKMEQKMRYEYKVIDYNKREKGVQTWPVSRNVSKIIDEYLEEGFTVIRVRREGSDRNNTKYYFTPVKETPGPTN